MKRILIVLLMLPAYTYAQFTAAQFLDTLFAQTPVSPMQLSRFEESYCAETSIGLISRNGEDTPTNCKEAFVYAASGVLNLSSTHLCLFDVNSEVHQAFAIVRGRDTCYVAKACLDGEQARCMRTFCATVAPATDVMYMHPHIPTGKSYWGPVPRLAPHVLKTMFVDVEAIIPITCSVLLGEIVHAEAHTLGGDTLKAVLELMHPNEYHPTYEELYLFCGCNISCTFVGSRVTTSINNIDYTLGFVEDIIQTRRNTFVIVQRLSP